MTGPEDVMWPRHPRRPGDEIVVNPQLGLYSSQDAGEFRGCHVKRPLEVRHEMQGAPVGGLAVEVAALEGKGGEHLEELNGGRVLGGDSRPDRVKVHQRRTDVNVEVSVCKCKLLGELEVP